MSLSRRASRRSTVLSVLTSLALAWGARPALAQGPAGSLEYPVKASLLLNFARFAEWPAGSPQATSSTVTICVLGRDPFGGVLDAVVAGRTVGGRGVEVRRYTNTEGIESCNVLFIASSAEDVLADALARVRQLPVLTVGESRDFEERGGVIRLLVEENHAGFTVSLSPTGANHLRLSSKLLGVARSVHGGGDR